MTATTVRRGQELYLRRFRSVRKFEQVFDLPELLPEHRNLLRLIGPSILHPQGNRTAFPAVFTGKRRLGYPTLARLAVTLLLTTGSNQFGDLKANPLDLLKNATQPYRLARGIPALPLCLAAPSPEELEKSFLCAKQQRWPNGTRPHLLCFFISESATPLGFHASGCFHLVRRGLRVWGRPGTTTGPHLVAAVYAARDDRGSRAQFVSGWAHPIRSKHQLILTDSQNERRVADAIDSVLLAERGFGVTAFRPLCKIAGTSSLPDFVFEIPSKRKLLVIEVLGFCEGEYLSKKEEQARVYRMRGHDYFPVRAFEWGPRNRRAYRNEMRRLRDAVANWRHETIHGFAVPE